VLQSEVVGVPVTEEELEVPQAMVVSEGKVTKVGAVLSVTVMV
jgi:hypothetical protein